MANFSVAGQLDENWIKLDDSPRILWWKLYGSCAEILRDLSSFQEDLVMKD